MQYTDLNISECFEDVFLLVETSGDEIVKLRRNRHLRRKRALVQKAYIILCRHVSQTTFCVVIDICIVSDTKQKS